MSLVRLVVMDKIGWIDATAMFSYDCSIPACGKQWHHLGGPLPYRPVPDPSTALPGRCLHPCPWCVRDVPEAAARAHRHRTIARQHLDYWKGEFDGRDG
jgi:hypothetical protein